MNPCSIFGASKQVQKRVQSFILLGSGETRKTLDEVGRSHYCSHCMASIHKRERSKFWIAAFTTADGRRLKKSTKETNKAKAQKIADEYEAATRSKRTLTQVRRVLGEFSLLYQGQDLQEPTFRELVSTWLDSKKATTAPGTQTFYKSATAKFTEWLGSKADKEVSAIAREDLVRFRNERSVAAAPKTVNHELKVLKMIFKTARRDGFLTEDPSEFVETVRSRANPGARKPFTIDQLKAVLAVCDSEWRSMVLFGLYLGQRLGDIANLRWSNLDTKNHIVRLVTAKTGKALQIPMSEALISHITSLPKPLTIDAPIHPRAHAAVARTGTTGGLSNQFADILAAAGLRNKKAHRKSDAPNCAGRDQSGLSFHSLRHTAVSLMKEAGIPQAAVMELIGHDSEQMSLHYTHTGIEALQKAASSLPRLL